MATHNYLGPTGLTRFWHDISPLNSVTGSPATFTSEFALPLDQCIANIDYTSSGVNKVTITVNGTATQISLGSTVYGGTLDVIHGIVTSNKASDGTELSEPIITYITPVEITPVVGSNSISADTGSISLKYTNSSNIQEYADVQFGSVSGNPATFNTSLALPLLECSTTFMATQEGTGDPSPTNVRNISGVEDITLTANGVDTVIDLDGTRYGGMLDVVSGELVLTKKIVDLSTITGWSYQERYDRFYSNKSITDYSGTQDTPDKAIFENLITSRDSLLPCAFVDGGNKVFVSHTGYTEVEPFLENIINGHYAVVTMQPQTIQLTPTQIETIVGSNSFASDTGNISLQYIESKSQLIDRIADYTHATGPAINNATLTIQKNGNTVNTFTANASTDTTANITVPTKTSDITNDSDFKAIIKLTQAEYDALEIAGEVDPETLYFITDGTPKIYASGVIFDNSFTNIPATNVQDALDLAITYMPNAGYHNSIYRGKNLGSTVTEAQYAAISAGTFEDMYIGDYWVIHDDLTNKDITWRIAHFDYWLNCGDTNTTTHHVVVVPDTILYSAKMNETNVTTGGYTHSLMRGGVTYQDTFTGDGTTTVFTLSYSSSFVINVKIGGTTQATSTYTISGTTLTFNTAPANGAAIEANYINTDYLNQGGLVQAKTMIEAAFGSAHILSHRELLSTASNSSGASNWGWTDSTVDLMSETMVYGCKVWANAGYDVGIDKEQLALFRHDHSRIVNRSYQWLRSFSSSSSFSFVYNNGHAYVNGASVSSGVRPAFALRS